ncbi:MAG TPA: secretin N-terminal domain-containing protein [Gemmatimonadaceae bacterium]|nr:secretin N-terminal domain-containing protein [Gemmatimonadaceae bacterium]
MMRARVLIAAIACSLASQHAQAQGDDSVMIRIVNLELRTAVQMLQQYLDRPVVMSGNGSATVTLETPKPVPRSAVLPLLRGLLDNNGFDLVADSSGQMYRARARASGPTFNPPTTQRVQQAALELFVLPLKHARADDVAGTVNALYGRVAQDGAGARAPSLSDALRTNQMPPVDAPPPQAIPGAAGRSASLSGDIVIVADARANSLLIRANRADFLLIEAVVQQLDVRPLQVMIEVLIAEVRRGRGLQLGVESTLGATEIGKTGTTIQGGVSSGPGLGDLALKVMNIDGLNLQATLRAGEDRGEVKILSRPVIFTTNNEEAEIVVGTQRPFIQLSRALPTDAAVRDQVVQYKEVGTKLLVRPTISVDGSVQLAVIQEVSGATNETAFNAPVISTRSVRTNLLIQDGRTMALGGLTDRQRESTRRGIPILSAIPILGGLFGQMTRRTDETELFVFLTPRVIRTDEDAARLTDPLHARAEARDK